MEIREQDSFCSFVSPGITFDSTFYEKFMCKAEVKSEYGDTLDISFYTDLGRYRIKIFRIHVMEIISCGENNFYIKTVSRPSLEHYKNKRFHRVPYDIFFSEDDNELIKLLLPHFLVLKLEVAEDELNCFYSFLVNSNIQPVDGWYLTEDWAEIPDFLKILSGPYLSWETKYSILVLLTNSLMKLEDLHLRNLKSFKSFPDFTLTNLVFLSVPFAPDLDPLRLPIKKPDYLKCLIKGICITPTTIILKPPKYETGNRVIRKYDDISNFFLRVNFCEESLETRIRGCSEEILERFRKVMDNLNILDYEFEFLGFSNSQIRNHSCWMTMRTSDSWVETIREELGDFSSCVNIAKYSARLGLCFSETYKTLDIEDDKIIYIPDIKRNGFVFSDGVGKISPEYFLQTRAILNIHPDEELSALQIRLGGCKGVLVLAPELDSRIAIRPSMYKFESNDRELEVCRFGKYRSAFLNRQIILLLNGLGIRDEVFLELQQELILEAKNTYNRELKSFFDKIKSFGVISDNSKFKIQYSPYTDNKKKSKILNDFTKEIRTKARIPVKESALLMGVLDEFKILLPNQTYIRTSFKGNSTVITGDVVIAKNPCLHPGDIRKLEAVDIPELAHLVNVVVFSQQGDRPLPNMCSGSDLDGDEYFVSWNKNLIPDLIYEPMVYDKEKESEEEITMEKVKDYFIEYMKSEALGKIANLHLAYADEKGIFSEEAFHLAKLHSRAVDYPKTGRPVEVPRCYKKNSWPDFMEKKDFRSYESPGIIGKLYRSLKSLQYL